MIPNRVAPLTRKVSLSQRWLGYGLALIAATCFAFIAVFGKILMSKGFTATQLLAIQLPIATMVAIPLMLINLWKRGAWHEVQVGFTKLFYLALQGIVGSAGTLYFSYRALAFLPASMATLLLFLYPVIVVFIFATTGIKKMAWYNYIVVILVVTGASLTLDLWVQLNTSARIPWQGVVYGLLSAFCYALYHFWGEVKLSHLSEMLTTVYTLFFASLTALVLLFITGDFQALADAVSTLVSGLVPLDLEVVIMFIVVALFSNLLPIYLIYRAINLIGADQVAILSTLELPITLALALFILKERLNPIQWLGILIIIAAIYILHTMEARTCKIQKV